MLVFVTLWQWCVELFSSFIENMEMFVGLLPSHFFQPHVTPETSFVYMSPLPAAHLHPSGTGQVIVMKNTGHLDLLTMQKRS